MTFYVPIDVLEENSARQDDPMQAVRDRLEVFGLTLSMKCSARGTSRRDGIPEGAAFTSDTLGAPMKGVYDGLVVSAPRACQFQALQKRYVAGADGLAMASKQAVTVAQSSFWAQDSRYLTLLPTQRGFLVARSVSYSFAGGQATGVTDNRPSEALAVVSFPGAVVGSFFSGITSAFKNSDVITGGKTGELTAQTEYLTAQMKYLQAKQELEKANGSATP